MNTVLPFIPALFLLSMKAMRSSLLKIAALLLALLSSARSADNILLIIADDLGADSFPLTASAGASVPPMPNIAALKTSGVLFRNACAHPTCSPSRAAMLTGRHPFRTGIGEALVGATSPQLQASEFTLPDAFAANAALGYQLASFGKWHLNSGPMSDNTPRRIGGWTYFAGSIPGAVTDYYNWSKVTVGPVNNVPTASTSTTYATTDTVNDAITWIQARGTSPWFAWVGFNAPHTPFHIPPTNLHSYGSGALTNRQKFEAAAEALDMEVKRLLEALTPAVRAKTNIIFLGDNGTPPQVVQTPYTSAHAKDTLYEGGTRVPMIVAGPAVVSPNRDSTALVHCADLYATILELAGINVSITQPAANPIDSHSLLPILKNTTDAARYAFSESFGDTVNGGDSGRALRDAAGYKLIQFLDGHEEMYAIGTDVNETSNLLAGTLSAAAQGSYYGLTIEMGKFQATLATPVVQNTALNGAQFTVRVNKTAGATYTLFRSSLLNYGTWLPVSGATFVDEGATVVLSDPASGGSAFFYRVMARQ